MPQHFTLLPGGQPYERNLAVSAYPETLIHDVDVAVSTTLQLIGGGQFEVFLKAPGVGSFIKLKDEADTGIPTVWDDETAPPTELLQAFDGTSSTGPWILRIENTGPNVFEGDLARFDVRLHHESQPPCVP